MNFKKINYKTQEMKEAVTMQEIIEALGYDEIHRSGNSKVINCPEHDDTHPSCMVYDHAYHCFACGGHGDIYRYIQMKTGKTFQEALKTVADIIGGDWTESGEQQFKKFPLTQEDMELLNLSQRSYGFYPVNMDEYGKVVTEKNSYSIRKLFLEDRETFYFIIKGKIKEMIEKYEKVKENFCSRAAVNTKILYDIFKDENGNIEDDVFIELKNACNTMIERLHSLEKKLAVV